MNRTVSILAGLAGIATRHAWAAAAWHAVLAAGLAARLAGWRPSRRALGLLAAVLLLSVSGFAFLDANGFNGIVFLLLGGLAATSAARAPSGPARPRSAWAVAAGAAMFAFGWAYPHFVAASSAVPYLYRAPTGLLPCPTLSLVTGLALALDDRRSGRWLGTLAGAGVFYGLFGFFALGVRIDAVLVLGSLTLVGDALVDRRRKALTGAIGADSPAVSQQARGPAP
jgi:hypothetical protein